ncbi:MAG: hypothetical protein KKH34_09070 [Candidatus Omnitrophica bacterium]|nr:hypothetical protein [Candidatus Omnitrophota bacterium]
MLRYNSKQKVKSGIPLGGIGAGKLEITPYGTIDYITCQNNWSNPIFNAGNKEKGKAQGIPGFHFALRVGTQAANICRLLQTEKIQHYATVKSIDYEGDFPFARLVYHDDNLPVDISLCAYSFLIPGDVKNSGIPAAVFEFTLTNNINKEIEAGLLMCARNLISRHSVGRMNFSGTDNGITGLNFTHASPLAADETAGDVFIGVPAASGEVSYWAGWNLQKDNFYFEKNIGLDAFEYFEKNGKLPNCDMEAPVESQSVELGGALSVRVGLRPQESKKISFIYAWHFPNHFLGHAYEKFFRKSREVAVYVAKEKDVLKKATAQLPAILENMGLEPWLSGALMNNLYTLFSSTWLTRNNDFTMYEAPLICPLMGTLDVYFYASVALGLLFPQLDKKALMLFKKNIRSYGYVPHDLGLGRIDLPSNGTTIPLWKDLNAKFILLAYRAYRDSGDLKFLKEMYPAIKRALEFSLTLDKNKDGLPDNEGFDTTFDTWGFKGLNSYTAGIFLVSLLAVKNIAEIFNDKKLAKRCITLFLNGKKTFQEKLWNGKFYITAKSDDKDYDACMVAQLTGQWYAYVLGLGRLFPEENIKSAIKWILKLNNKDSSFGTTNAVFINGKRDKESYHSQNIWPGVCYAFGALAIYEGFVKEGLQLTRKVWDTIVVKNRNPWNQSDVIIAEDGSFGFGDYYMRNSVIWAVLLALSEKDERVEKGLVKIKEIVQASLI